LLQRTLKANVREEKERALTGLKHQLEQATKSNQDYKMAKRYQMVRFFGILASVVRFNIQSGRKPPDDYGKP
jgi:hypothetical protein